MIEQLVNAEPRGRGLTRDSQNLANPVDNGKRRGAAILDDAQEHRASAIFTHDVLLHCPAVVRLADVPYENGLAVGVCDWNIIEIGDGRRHRIGAHRVLRVADLGETRR